MSKTVFFDLETGGTDYRHPIIQIAAVAVDDATQAELETFEAKLKFDPAHCNAEALAVNHYSEEAWKDAKVPPIVVAEFKAFLDRHATVERKGKKPPHRSFYTARMAGHNAAHFDFPRLQSLFSNHATFLPGDFLVYDTLQRALWYFREHDIPQPDSFRLSDLCKHFGIQSDGAHEALADVRMTIALTQAIRTATQPQK